MSAQFSYIEVEDILTVSEAKGEKPFILILDGVEDPRNFGAILRTAEAAGVHGVVIPKNRSVSLTETVEKTSTGAARIVPVAKVTNISQTIEKLKEKNVWIIGVEIDGKERYDQIDYKSRGIALVFGSEGKGTSRLVKEHCDHLVVIPMKGQISSLNVSVSAGILMFEVNRQRA